MSRKEKIIWYVIWVLGIAIVSFLVAIELLGSRRWPNALLVSWTTVCLQLPLLLLLRQRRKRLRGETTTDERLKMIRRNASEICATVFLFICWLACLILFLIYTQQGKEAITIKIEWLVWFVTSSAVVLALFTFLTIRVLRGRGTKNGQE